MTGTADLPPAGALPRVRVVAILGLALLGLAAARATARERAFVHRTPAYEISYPGDWVASSEDAVTAFAGQSGTAAEYVRLELHSMRSGPGTRFRDPHGVASFFRERIRELFPDARFFEEGSLVYRGAGGERTVPTFKGEYLKKDLGVSFRFWFTALPNADPGWLHGALYVAPVRYQGVAYYEQFAPVVEAMLNTLTTGGGTTPPPVGADRAEDEGQAVLDLCVALLDSLVADRSRDVARLASTELARDLAGPAGREALRSAGLRPGSRVVKASARGLPDGSLAVHLTLQRPGTLPLIASMSVHDGRIQSLGFREVR